MRYYNPRLGRWIAPDPIGTADGPNLYAYVQNSPLINFDLFGLYGMRCKETSSGYTNFNSIEDFSEYATSCLRNATMPYQLGQPELPNAEIGLTNGMMTEFDYAQGNAMMLCEMTGGYNIHGTYNGTKSFILDVGRSAYELYSRLQ